MVMQNERGQNTHSQGERLKIPLLPNNLGKKSANNMGPQQGHDNTFFDITLLLLTLTFEYFYFAWHATHVAGLFKIEFFNG